MNVEQLVMSIDAEKFAAIRRRYADEDAAKGGHRAKYLDLDGWFHVNLRRAKQLGLDATPRRSVLDLGCGCGYFLYVCKLLGHVAIGIDRPERRSLYTEMRDLLGVLTIPHVIEPLSKLPDVGSVDVVTAHMVCFNGHRTSPWGLAEWSFLLDDLADRGARTAYLELNYEPDWSLLPPGVEEMFERRGAHIDGHRVLIDRLR